MKKFFGVISSMLTGMAIGGTISSIIKSKAINKESQRVNKFKDYYYLLNQWLILKQEGKTLEQYFINKGYKTIAIYGMGELGNRLYDELKGTTVEVKYAIDKNAGNTYGELEVFDLENNFEAVDAVIVTAIFAMEEIEKELNMILEYPIISLEEVIYEM